MIINLINHFKPGFIDNNKKKKTSGPRKNLQKAKHLPERHDPTDAKRH